MALLLALGFSSATAAASKSNTFTLSGQLAGTLTLNSSMTCIAGNIEKAPGEDTVRVYLTDHDIKPTNAVWYLIVDAKSPGTAHYPAPYPDTTSLGASAGATINDEWTAGHTGSGTVVLAANLKSGSINLQLPPGQDQTGAKHTEKIVGNWNCP